jgi:predicted ATPase
MFDYIKIEGFRSFRRIELELSPLAVLIGPNGSGKSNFLDLISLIAEAGQGQLGEGIASRGGFDNVAFKGEPGDIFVEFRFRPEGVFVEERANVRFKLGLKKIGVNARVWVEQVSKDPDPRHQFPLALMKRDKDGCIFRSIQTGMIEEVEEGKALESESELAIFQVKDQNNYPTPYKLLRHLQQWTLYHDMDVGPNAPMRQPGLIRPTVRLTPNGANLASVLYSIKEQYPATWREIEEILKTAYPEFHSITIPPEGGDGKVVLRWVERPYERENGFSANLLSDGTLKLLCLIAILKSPDPPPLICIDEPELGLHPDWIKLVAELLQDAASRTQVIVATHSPQIVAKLDPEQLIVTEKVEGKTHLKRLASGDLEKWLKDFNLSDLWLAGHFGGRP